MEQLIQKVVLCGTGADLFTLPLVVCTAMTACGAIHPPTQLLWMGSWPAVAVSLVALGTEIALDVSVPRQTKELQRAWNAVQWVLSVMVTVIVVFTMTADESRRAIVTDLLAALTSTQLLRSGLVNRLKDLLEWLPE